MRTLRVASTSDGNLLVGLAVRPSSEEQPFDLNISGFFEPDDVRVERSGDVLSITHRGDRNVDVNGFVPALAAIEARGVRFAELTVGAGAMVDSIDCTDSGVEVDYEALDSGDVSVVGSNCQLIVESSGRGFTVRGTATNSGVRLDALGSFDISLEDGALVGADTNGGADSLRLTRSSALICPRGEIDIVARDESRAELLCEPTRLGEDVDDSSEIVRFF